MNLTLEFSEEISDKIGINSPPSDPKTSPSAT